MISPNTFTEEAKPMPLMMQAVGAVAVLGVGAGVAVYNKINPEHATLDQLFLSEPTYDTGQ
ncbi:MAG TPA: hypothetical protein VF401_00770 [Candidatus Saccharimonadales bacterium]